MQLQGCEGEGDPPGERRGPRRLGDGEDHDAGQEREPRVEIAEQQPDRERQHERRQGQDRQGESSGGSLRRQTASELLPNDDQRPRRQPTSPPA